jgi:uncharacterized protein with PIN domain
MVAILSPATILLRRFRYAQQFYRCEVPNKTDWEDLPWRPLRDVAHAQREGKGTSLNELLVDVVTLLSVDG